MIVIPRSARYEIGLIKKPSVLKNRSVACTAARMIARGAFHFTRALWPVIQDNPDMYRKAKTGSGCAGNLRLTDIDCRDYQRIVVRIMVGGDGTSQRNHTELCREVWLSS